MRLSRFVIHGGRPLEGEIRASGSKNAVLQMIAAAMLTEEEVVLENVPSIRDVDVMLEIAGVLGAEVARLGDRVTIRAANLNQQVLPQQLCERVRTSVLFVAPLLHRLGRAKLHPPGGDGIGRRRLDTHFYGLRQLGASVDDREFDFQARAGLEGAMIFFDEASVTATEHILMAAALSRGTTTILNAASEPHVMDLAKLLLAMGARIEGLYTNTLTITGVEKLSGATHRVVSDHIEVSSYLALAAATGGGITIHDTLRGHYWMMHRVFERFGIEIDIKSDRIVLPSGQTPRLQPDAGGAIPQVDDGPWPQFPTDMMSPFLVLATQAEGTILFFEKMFEGRMYFVDPLVQMGANAIICDPHRVIISGPSALRGQTVRSPDIRAGMAMIMAALCSTKRPCIVQNAEIVDRGYERVEEKLRSIGADIVRDPD
ncbi:MAG: UDP-N-acetylglucosamine 1-carboxyvinyltransferase [Deltaproteobacteria bacterium]|nr:UDP-N-acetylglucosamine 1-carboxyvinyltransferase [Deltaproteobacteria bacterium]